MKHNISTMLDVFRAADSKSGVIFFYNDWQSKQHEREPIKMFD